MPSGITWSRKWGALIALFCGLGLSAQQVPLSTFEPNQAISINPYVEVYQTPDSLSAEEVIARIKNGDLKPAENKTSPGFSRDYFWIRFILTDDQSGDWVLELDNPHIDFVNLFEVKGDEGFLVGRGGDKQAFSYRTEINRRYVFSIEMAGQPREFLLMVDKRNASVSFPLRLWTEATFGTNESMSNLLYGIYFGILAFVSAFSFVIGVGMRERNFLSYGIYVAIIAMYMFTQLGFSFQYLYPESSAFNNYSRVIFSFSLLITSMDFFSRLLDIRKYLPLLSKIYKIGWVFLGVVFVIWLLNRLFNPAYAQYTILTLNILYLFILGFFGSVFYVSIKTWRFQRGNVLLVMFAFFALMVGASIYILIEYGVISESFFPINPIIIGSMLEVLILSVSMAYRVKTLNERKNELSNKLLRQQKDLMRAFIRGGDMERKRISEELHDNIGSSLSLLKNSLANERFDPKIVNADIDALCEEVRTLSHRLVPHQMELIGFSEVLADYCKRYERDSGIKVALDQFDFPVLPEHMSVPLLRIVQEALQNILKHAQATEVEIQLVGYQEEIVITIDDNGVGFDPVQMAGGNGLINMQTRCELLHGHMDISSHEGKGTNILMTIPI